MNCGDKTKHSENITANNGGSGKINPNLRNCEFCGRIVDLEKDRSCPACGGKISLPLTDTSKKFPEPVKEDILAISNKNEPRKIGDKDICGMCGREVVFLGEYWEHTAGKMRHGGDPKREMDEEDERRKNKNKETVYR